MTLRGPFCVKIDTRKLIPGIKVDTGQKKWGQPVIKEYRDVWILIDRSSEQPMTKKGSKKTSESHLMPRDYCLSMEEAQKAAKAIHDRGCMLKKCAWKDHKPPPEKKQTFTRYYNLAGSWPTPTPPKKP